MRMLGAVRCNIPRYHCGTVVVDRRRRLVLEHAPTSAIIMIFVDLRNLNRIDGDTSKVTHNASHYAI